MTDYFLKKFYNDVSGVNWPPVDQYNDFLKLPKEIIDECYTVHQFQQRKDLLESKQYWSRNLGNSMGYKCNDLVYVPVRKCGHSHYTKLLHDYHKWELVNLQDIDWNTVTPFGLIMHPLTRRLKGLTECLTSSYKQDYSAILTLLDNPGFQNFIKTITLTDSHTTPYSEMFRNFLNNVRWIPIEFATRNTIESWLSQLFKAHNVNVDFSVMQRYINESNSEKVQVFEKIKTICMSEEPNGELYFLFSEDLKFYHNLIDQYTNRTPMDILLNGM